MDFIWVFWKTKKVSTRCEARNFIWGFHFYHGRVSFSSELQNTFVNFENQQRLLRDVKFNKFYAFFLFMKNLKLKLRPFLLTCKEVWFSSAIFFLFSDTNFGVTLHKTPAKKSRITGLEGTHTHTSDLEFDGKDKLKKWKTKWPILCLVCTRVTPLSLVFFTIHFFSTHTHTHKIAYQKINFTV